MFWGSEVVDKERERVRHFGRLSLKPNVTPACLELPPPPTMPHVTYLAYLSCLCDLGHVTHPLWASVSS